METQAGAAFGDLLREYRLAAGLTQEALAERAGLSARNLRALEQGGSTPQRETARRLTTALGLAGVDLARFLAAATPGPRRRTASGAIDLPASFPPPQRPAAPPHNLPLQPTSLIGREQDVATVRQRLRDPQVRLLTLTGPGGAGKTRLALAVAAELLDDFADGVWFVDLAPISDPALVATTIARVLGLQEGAQHAFSEGLQASLRDKHLLLLLDNFEQVVAATPLLADLLAAAPGLKLLVTSRAMLHLRGEHEFVTPPLDLPDPRRLADLATLAQVAAVALFLQRARAVKPDFALTPANAPMIAAICVQLDGLPLAIELAAARIKLLPPPALLARLDQRLRVLTGGARDLPARQQTLRAAIAWSYELLDPGEQTLWTRLAVFVGGRALAAVEAVCTADADLALDVLDGLQALLDKHLLYQAEGVDGEPHFFMLETLWEYALERLAASPDAEALRRRHAAYYLALAEAAEPELNGGQQGIWLARLEEEHDNLRAALRWAMRPAGAAEDAALALRLGGVLGPFWFAHGHLSEGRRWLETALAAPGVVATPAWDALRARALREAGLLAQAQGDYGAARDLCAASLTLARALGDQRGMAVALDYLGIIANYLGDKPAARAFYAESLALQRTLGDQRGVALALLHLGVVAADQGDYPAARAGYAESLAICRARGDRRTSAVLLHNLGVVAEEQGDFRVAEPLFEESLATMRELGATRGSAYPLLNLGIVALEQGHYPVARMRFAESLALLREVGDKRGIAYALEGYAAIASGEGDARRALRLAGAAAAFREAIAASLPPSQAPRLERWLAPARQTVSDEEEQAAWAAGQAMTLEHAVAYALDTDGAERSYEL